MPQTDGVAAIVLHPGTRRARRGLSTGHKLKTGQGSAKELGLRVSRRPWIHKSCDNHHILDSSACSWPQKIYHGKGSLCDSSKYHRARRMRASMTLMVARGNYKKVTCKLSSSYYPSNTQFFHLHTFSVASVGSGILFTSFFRPSEITHSSLNKNHFDTQF